MGYKSRGNWYIGICLKNCKNRNKKCKECIRFSEYKKEKLNEIKRNN